MLIVRLFILLFFTTSYVYAVVPSLEEFAQHVQFIDVKISPTGQYLAATNRTDDNHIQLTVIDRNKMSIVSQRHFSSPDSIASFSWANNERIILSLARDVGALEQPMLTGELFSVEASDAQGKRSLMLTGIKSRARDITASEVIDWLPQDKEHIIIASYSLLTAEPLVSFYRLNINTGRKRGLGTAPIRVVRGTQIHALTDSEGYPKLVAGIDPKDTSKFSVLYREKRGGNWSQIARYDRESGVFIPLAFTANNMAVYGLSNSQSNTQTISKLDIASGKELILAVHPSVDLTPVFSFRQSRVSEVIAATYEYENRGVQFFSDIEDKEFSANFQGLVNAFPQHAVNVNSATADNKLQVLQVKSANAPASFYLFHAESQQVSFLLGSAPWLMDRELPQTEIIQYQARDGQQLTALLTLPVGVDAKNLPLIMLPHGGPHGVRNTITEFDRDAKVLAANGYAVLQPNFRGSGGFGKAFLTAGYKKWGTLMIDDMTDGVRHVIAQGIADERRVAVYGGSYGGYASLMSAIREPDLYRCAINFVGMSDLALMYKEGDTTESAFAVDMLESFIGRSEEVLKSQSAIHNLDKLKAPVLIIHGEEDRRVPLIQAEVLKKAFDERGHPYEWLVKQKEGHGFYKPENNVERWQRMLAFLEKHMAI